MLRKITTRISPASCVEMLALFVALGGISYAAAGKIGTAGLKNGAITKQKLKKESVVTAKIKNDAVTGDKVLESSLATVPDASKLAGQGPTAFQSKGFGGNSDTLLVNLPPSASTVVAGQALPAGTYLVLGRGGLNNNGPEVGSGQKCSINAGASSQTVSFNALAANGKPADREEFSVMVIATLTEPGEAQLSCKTNGAWTSGNVTSPSIAAVSLQP